MQNFKDLSIKTKLILLTATCSTIALLLTCTGFVAQNIETSRQSKIEQLQSQAQMLAFNSTAVLTFRNEAAAEQLLESLRLEPSIEFACLYDSEHQLLAAYQRESTREFAAPVVLRNGYEFNEAGFLSMFEDVIDEDEKVGTLFLLANMQELRAKLIGYLKIVGFVSAGALLVSVGLAILLQRTISHPVVQLAQAAQDITQTDDYSIRVERRSNDEIGRLCAAFNRMIDQVQNSQHALRTSVANMSHEIRTPINAILGFTELLRNNGDELDPERRREFLNTIHTSSNHLLNLINDILDLSKIEAGQLEIDCVRCSPHQILSDVVSVLRVRAQEKGIELDYDWASQVPETIVTDPDRLRQLLINLVNNSIKFTQTGGVRIVATVKGKPDDAALILEVIDTGIGIPEDKLQTIFEPFVQADGSVTRNFGGTGLGLAISRQIARRLGGNLTASSRLNQGSTFTAVTAAGDLRGVHFFEPSAADLRIERQDDTQAAPTQLPPAKVLVVEDGETNRRLIELILEQAGVEVTMAENGKIGVDLAAQQRFDLILMDMQMPVMDGYTASTELRRRGLTIPIIALTAHAMKGDEAKCLAAGCSGFLTKPINSEKLLLTLGDELASGQLQTQCREFPGATSGAPAVRSASCVSTRTSRSIAEETGSASPSSIEKPDDVSARLETILGEVDRAIADDAAAAPQTTVPQRLISRLPTDDPRFREIVERFVDRLGDQLAAMQAAWKAKDFTELANLAHWLKGTGGSVGFDAFTEPAKELEQLAKQQQSEGIECAIVNLESLASLIVVPKSKLPISTR